MFWRKPKEPADLGPEPNHQSEPDLQRQAHQAYGGRAAELRALMLARGRDAIAAGVDVDAYMAEDYAGACLERTIGGPHEQVWCVRERGHRGDHAGRCLWCDLVLLIVEEAESRGDPSLRMWVRKGDPTVEATPRSLVVEGSPLSYGSNDWQVFEFIATIKTLGAEAWVHGVLAAYGRQDRPEVDAAWARLLAAVAAAQERGQGDALRAADGQAVAIVEATLPAAQMDSDTLRLSKEALQRATRGALLALVLRDSLDGTVFTILFAPFAGVAHL